MFATAVKVSNESLIPIVIFINNQQSNSLFSLISASLPPSGASASDFHLYHLNQLIDESKSKIPQTPFSFEHIKHQDNEYHIYNINHQFSYLLDLIIPGVHAAEANEAAVKLAGVPVGLPGVEIGTGKQAMRKIFVLVEFDLDDLQMTYKTIMKIKSLPENAISYSGLILGIDKVVKPKYNAWDILYKGYEDKVDYIQQLIRSSAMNLPNCLVSSLSCSRPSSISKFTKYLGYLVQSDLENSAESVDSFSPDILSIESLFIPIRYDSSLKIQVLNDTFPVDQFSNLSLNQIPNLILEIKTVLDGGYFEHKEDELSSCSLARDEQDLLVNIKTVIDKLSDDRQNIITKKPNFKEMMESSKSTNPIGLNRDTAVKTSSSRIGGLATFSNETKALSNSSSSLSGREAINSTALLKGTKSTTTSQSQDSDDMSAKIAKLLEQSKTVKEKFTSHSSLSTTAAGLSAEDGSSNSNEMLSAYFQSLLKK